ncbi:MAG: D-alanyl-D-alanine carboxypeptidase [Actinobacteria bacterium]|nr:D-alanyl-D-alanine carboxypeptidase [Actinomycetota bacterium]
MKKKVAAYSCLLLLLATCTPITANALDPNSVATVFTKLTASKELANPSVVVIDQESGEVVFEKNSNSLRKPASLQKIFTAVAAIENLPMDTEFETSVWVGNSAKSIVIQGSSDPWISYRSTEATKMRRTSMPKISAASIKALKESNKGSVRNSTIYYTGLYSRDVANLRILLRKGGVNAVMKRVTKQEAIDKSESLVFESRSPQLEEILTFTLVWSDNVLAERIARLAARAAGNTYDDAGVAATFTSILSNFDIDSSSLVVEDASGLSKENRVTAQQVGQLLVKIHKDERYDSLINGLPVGGISGTLRHRFLKTAPNAIGLVKAKSGSLNGTANLAGYVESGDREYAFVIIADKIKRGNSAGDRARAMMDKILGKIASPLLPQLPAETEIEILSSDKPL